MSHASSSLVAQLNWTSFRTVSPFMAYPCNGGAKAAKANFRPLHGFTHLWGWEIVDDQDIGVGKRSKETKPLLGYCEPWVHFVYRCHNICLIFRLRCFSGWSEEAAHLRGNCHSESRHPSATCHRSNGIHPTQVVGGRKLVSNGLLVCDAQNWQVVSRWRIRWDSQHPKFLTTNQDNKIQCWWLHPASESKYMDSKHSQPFGRQVEGPCHKI